MRFKNVKGLGKLYFLVHEQNSITKFLLTAYINKPYRLTNCKVDHYEMYVSKIICFLLIVNNTYIAGKTFIFFHESFIFLVDFKYFANSVRSSFSLKYIKINLDFISRTT